MIIDKIVLTNFGVYKGRHEIVLTPPSKDKPIILFGGLNGAGKTTFLDALQLALYGKLANCSNRKNLGYEKYLQNCINRQSEPSVGAGLEITFRQTSAGESHSYRISRKWSMDGQKVKEKTAVYKDNVLDDLLTDNWNDFVGGIIPPQIAGLFFFDGEKIAEIAEPENTAQFLRTAINSLLGLDVIEQLRNDLAVLIRRKQTAMKSSGEREKIDAAEKALEALIAKNEKLKSLMASNKNAIEQTQKKITKKQQHYKTAGGALFDQREQLEATKRALATELSRIEETLRDLAGGALPLALVSNLLKEMAEQAAKERAKATEGLLLQKIHERDDLLLKHITKLKLTAPHLSGIKQFLKKDRSERGSIISSIETYLDADQAVLDQSRHLIAEILPAQQQSAGKVLEKHQKLTDDLFTVDRKIEAIPDPETLKELVAELQNLKVEEQKQKIRQVAYEEECAALKAQIELADKALVKLIESSVDDQLEQADIDRTVIHSMKARNHLETFRQRIIETNIQKLEGLILQSFQELIRKEDLLSAIRINSENYTLTLLDAQGSELATDRLSAGERQLLAVAMLWGLARAAGRPLPAIVDTPLGRLDSTHRKHLVSRYFPYASHQVMLLSTDEEIDENHLDHLRPQIGRSYYLDFNNKTKSTEIKEGYFWKETRK